MMSLVIHGLFKLNVRLVSLLLALFFCLNGQAAGAEHLFRLSEFHAGDKTLRLLGERDSHTLTIPLSPLVQVSSARIQLKAISSIALLERRSVLNVRLNNVTIGQIAFNSNRPEFSADIDIPASLWREEYNALTFSVSQHSDICQATDAPELWSEINLYESSLTLNTKIASGELSLQQLSNYFHPGIGSQRHANIYAFSNDVSLPLIHQAALPAIAQGLALREIYRGVEFDYQLLEPLNEQSGNLTNLKSAKLINSYQQSSWYLGQERSDDLHVIVGTRDVLASYLPEAVTQSIQGPFLRINKTAHVKIGKKTVVEPQVRLIVSGITGEDVVEAARGLAYMDDALNPDHQVNILKRADSIVSPLQQNVPLHPEQAYLFSQLGAGSATFTGDGTFAKTVNVRLPADFYVAESSKVNLSLDFSYGAGHGKGSILNILVNDSVVHGLALDDIDGHTFRNYSVSVPARYFRGGVNKLVFYITQKTEQIPDKCTNISAEFLRFHLSNLSKISIPEAAHLARQPDLRLMAETGYPFAKFTGAEETSIYITQSEMMSGALTLTGKLAQSAGNLIPNLNVVYGLPKKLTSNAIVLAKPADLHKAIFSHVSASVANVKQWPYRLQNQLYNSVSENRYDSDIHSSAATDFTLEESSLGQFSVLIATKNPSAEGVGTLFVFAAGSSSILTERMNQLVKMPLWSQLTGDFFVWQDAQKPLMVMQISEPYETGKAETVMELRAWLSNSPWYWLTGALVLVLLTSAIAYLLLKRRHKKIKEEW